MAVHPDPVIVNSHTDSYRVPDGSERHGCSHGPTTAAGPARGPQLDALHSQLHVFRVLAQPDVVSIILAFSRFVRLGLVLISDNVGWYSVPMAP